MADFTQAQISGPSGGGPSPQAPVQQPSAGLAIASGLADIFRAGTANASSRAAQARYQQEQEVQSMGHKTVSRFAQQQMQIADAVDRGDLSSQQARRQMRINLSRALADNPSFEKEIRAAHGDILGTAGMGKVAAEGTQQEQAFFNVMGEASSNGWITPDMAPEEANQATLDYMAFKRTQQGIDAQQNELALKRAQLGYQTDQVQAQTARISQAQARTNLASSQITLANKQAEMAGQKALGELNATYHPQFQRQSNQIINRFNNGELSPEDANAALDQMEQQYQSMAAQIGANASPSYIQNLSTPYNTTIKNARQVITGQRTLDSYRNSVDIASAQAQMTMSGDPEMTRAIALADTFPNAPEVQQMVSNTVARKIGDWAKPEKTSAINATDPDEQADTQESLRFMKSNLATIYTQPGEVTDDQKQTVDRTVNRLLKGVDAFGASVDDPSQLNDLVDFFASDEYGNYVGSTGTGISTEMASRASDIIAAEYGNVVAPLVRDEYERATIDTSIMPAGQRRGAAPPETPVASSITPAWSGNGLVFRAEPGAGATARAKVRELNRRVAPVVTKLVKAGAHLSGNSNYESIYNDQFASLFGGEEQPAD